MLALRCCLEHVGCVVVMVVGGRWFKSCSGQRKWIVTAEHAGALRGGYGAVLGGCWGTFSGMCACNGTTGAVPRWCFAGLQWAGCVAGTGPAVRYPKTRKRQLTSAVMELAGPSRWVSPAATGQSLAKRDSQGRDHDRCGLPRHVACSPRLFTESKVAKPEFKLSVTGDLHEIEIPPVPKLGAPHTSPSSSLFLSATRESHWPC